MALSRRALLFGAGGASVASLLRASPSVTSVTPEMFGAKGDGRTNDTKAFAAMSAHLNARGGGTITLRRVTYLVGEQRRGAGGHELSFEPLDIIHLSHCSRSIRIAGNGAKLRCAPGLRYGRFDPRSGKSLPDARKLDITNKAAPYQGIVWIEHCSASVEISDLELDGNLGALVVGGRAFPGGWEAGGVGIRLYANRGPERLFRIYSHHHAVDGIMVTPAADRSGATHMTDVICDYNGRQGCSITAGRNFLLERCTFRRTGRAGLGASPGAGVDIEAEESPIRNVVFSSCEFSDNIGFGMVAGSGDSADIRFSGCKFIGTTNLSAWPDKPGIRFDNCLFVGAINHSHGDANPSRATQFHHCTFTDNPALSPTGKVYIPHPGKWIAIVLQSPNVLFSHCRFHLIAEGVLPISQHNVIYEDCVMSQRSSDPSGPRGTYIGTNSINGNAHLEDSIIRGIVKVNGHLLPIQR